MKLLPICVLILISLFVEGHTEENLSCYKCEDCYEVKNDQVQSCTSETTDAPSSSSSSTEAVTEPPGSSTKAPSSSTEAVTEPPGSSTKAPSSSTSSTVPPTTENPNPADLPSNRFRREIHNVTNFLRAAPTQHCYTIDLLDGDKRKVNRGCIEVPEDKDACAILKEEFGSLDKCKICSTNECNNSSPLKLSLAVLLMALVLRKIC